MSLVFSDHALQTAVLNHTEGILQTLVYIGTSGNSRASLYLTLTSHSWGKVNNLQPEEAKAWATWHCEARSC
jgi:hypothetical protein